MSYSAYLTVPRYFYFTSFTFCMQDLYLYQSIALEYCFTFFPLLLIIMNVRIHNTIRNTYFLFIHHLYVFQTIVCVNVSEKQNVRPAWDMLSHVVHVRSAPWCSPIQQHTVVKSFFIFIISSSLPRLSSLSWFLSFFSMYPFLRVCLPPLTSVCLCSSLHCCFCVMH